MSPSSRLAITAARLTFETPIVLASGTAGYGMELEDVVDFALVGALVTKAVSVEPREGNAAPRVAELGEGGMINAVGLANPGLALVEREIVPWLGTHLLRTRKVVNVVGRAIEEFAEVVARLDAAPNEAIHAFELNVSCPNVRAGGTEFGADPAALASLVRAARAATARPLFVKLSPILPDVAATARVAVDAGADGITVVNTIPGLLIDVDRRAPVLGFGSGGVSGPGLLPVGVLATWKVARAVAVPVIGVGGVATATDALQYLLAGASLVGIGTAALRDPRAPARIARDLERWCARQGVRAIGEIVGTLDWNR